MVGASSPKAAAVLDEASPWWLEHMEHIDHRSWRTCVLSGAASAEVSVEAVRTCTRLGYIERKGHMEVKMLEVAGSNLSLGNIGHRYGHRS